MEPSLRIAIADDHALFRQGLRSLLDLRPDLAVVAEVERLDGLDAALDRARCDLLLLDLQMERSSLIEIAALTKRVKVIVVTASEQPRDALEAIRAGAHAVVFKRFAIETLMEAIDTVRSGQVWMPASLQTHIAAELREPQPEPLTTREREVVRHVALGLRNAEVARKLFVSEDTIKTHLNNVFRKLGLRDRAQLTRYAIRVGIIGTHEQPP